MMIATFIQLHAEGDGVKTTSALHLGAGWTGDMAHSLTGGLKRGSAYLGMATFNAGLDTETAGLWKGGFFGVTAVRTLGAMPSYDLFGDAQVTSNIEAGDHLFLMELSFRQKFGPAEVTLGLQDLNAVFALSESGGLFLNSSFGIMPVITGNIPVPVFPLTSPGITVVMKTGHSGSVATALHDGRPVPFENNPFNTRWKFASGDGLIAIAEYRHLVEHKGITGNYKIGVFSHSHIIEKLLMVELPDTVCGPTFGAYVIADQPVWRSGDRQAALFMQAGYSPSKESYIDFTCAFGVNFTALIRGRENDLAGLAVTAGRFSEDRSTETVIELTYRIQFSENIFLQPDLQYIIHPSGSSSGIPHCLAGFLRLGVSL